LRIDLEDPLDERRQVSSSSNRCSGVSLAAATAALAARAGQGRGPRRGQAARCSAGGGGVYHLDRGDDRMERTLQQLGADIERANIDAV